jgi:hypothetical protein
MIFYKTKNGTLAMKKHYGGKHFDIFQVIWMILHYDSLEYIPLRRKFPRFKKW